jgi:hypothetical protein
MKTNNSTTLHSATSIGQMLRNQHLGNFLFPPIINGQQWGDWQLEDTFLVLHPQERYYIDLKEITCSAQMLDRIFQMRGKMWVDDKILGDLLMAFQDIFAPQGTLCSRGEDKHLDAISHLKHTIKSAV